jgi:AcrR family transcriptional regulator
VLLVSCGTNDGHTARPAGRSRRSACARIQTAATILFHREGIRATGVERLTEHAHVSKRTFYQHFSSKNDLAEEYLRRIHQAGGMLREQAIDTADASPRGRPLAHSIAPRAAVSAAVHFTTPLSRQAKCKPFGMLDA